MSIQGERHFYTGKDELENWITWAWIPRSLCVASLVYSWTICSTGTAHRMCLFFCNKIVIWRTDVNNLFRWDIELLFLQNNSQLFLFRKHTRIVLLIIFGKVCAKDDLLVIEFNFKMLLLKLCLMYIYIYIYIYIYTHTHKRI